MTRWSSARIILLSLWAASAPFASAEAAEAPGGGCTLEKVAELPVVMNERRPMVKAKINGVDQLFMADSGAVFSMIPPSVATRLKMPLRAAPSGLQMTGVGGSFAVQMAEAATFEIAGRTMRNISFMVGGADDGRGTALLGQNVLGVADSQYNLAEGWIRLVKPNRCGEGAAQAWAQGQPYSAMDIEPVEGTRQHIAGEASINGIPLRVVFDTGSPTTLLSLSMAKRADYSPGRPGVIPVGVSNGLGGAAGQTWVAPEASYRIGGRDMRGDALRIADLGSVPFDLLIGADFFLAHRVYVARSQNRLYFTHALRDGVGSLPALADAAAYGRRGDEFTAKRDWPNAIADFTRAIELAPNEPRYLVQRATARMDFGLSLLARHDLDEAIRQKPDLFEARMARALLAFTERNLPLAGEDLQIAARVAPRTADQRFVFAEMFAGMEDWQRSREQFDLWLETHNSDPRRPIALNATCWAGAMLNQELGRALEACNAALREAPGNIDFMDSRALVQLRMGKADDAIADYDTVLAARPSAGWSLFGRGLAKMRQGRAAEGRADIAAGVAQMPDLPQQAARIGLIRSATDLR